MANNIVPVSKTDSPFDSIRRFRADGSEYWLGRELMEVLGYENWQNFGQVIEIAIENIVFAGEDPDCHTLFLAVKRTLTSVQPSDYQLSRFACYHVALACDGRGKPEVKAAKQYFVVKTREAEVAIPAISEKLEIARLENENLKMQLQKVQIQDTRIAIHGLPITLLLEGKSDAIVEVDRPTLEVIDERNNTRYSGQTLVQLKEYLAQNHGVKFKSGADLKRELERQNLGHLIAQTPRSVLSDYLPMENIKQAIQALTDRTEQQQLLI